MILGLDVGTKRIGVAIMHEESLFPIQLETIDLNKQSGIDAISQIIAENKVKVVVVGYPRRQNGLESEQTIKVVEYMKLVKEVNMDCEFVYQDESVTSVLAEEELGSNNKAYSKEAVDALAAVYILEDYAKLKRGLA